MTALARRTWVPPASESFVQAVAAEVAAQEAGATAHEIEALVEQSRIVHERTCVNLNPAGNVMNPRAEALLARGLGSRASLGYPRAKQEMGLEAIERIESIAAALASEVFGARFVELRVPSGALANLYVFLATTRPGDGIVALGGAMGGHVSHHAAGAAGLRGLIAHAIPADPCSLRIDLDRLRELALGVRPKLISLGGSFNLFPQPIREVRGIADEAGAMVLYDAAHMSGPIAGRAWQQPLDEGAHVMTMSTYKSLGGPAGGLILTNDPALAERLDRIAFPGLTANFDVAKTAALAMTLLDWRVHGPAYARSMLSVARCLAERLAETGTPLFAGDLGFTASHQFAIQAAAYGGGRTAALRLRRANILTCGVNLPPGPVGDDVSGLRIGTPEIVRWGMAEGDMSALATFIARALRGAEDPETMAAEVTAFRKPFDTVRYAI